MESGSRFDPTLESMTLTTEMCNRFLSLYEKALASRIVGHKSKAKESNLLELDSWRLTKLSKNVRERHPAYMTKDELEKLMDCKLYLYFKLLSNTDREESFDRV
jgi:hypothetical protein